MKISFLQRESILGRAGIRPLTCMLSLYLLTSVFAAQERNYKNWMNEDVYWIITPEEKKAFKKLKTDEEKENFINLFWAKRDPTPLDEQNEFKETYYKRLDYVNRRFTRGPQRGWKTDAGKILIFFGPPRERQSDPETWYYDPIPYLGLDSEFKVIFNNTFSLDSQMTSMTVLKAIDEFPQQIIFNPDLK